MDTISVIIPTHNRASLLPIAVRSVLNQTRPAAEIIIVDDGSSDATASVVRDLGHRATAPIVYISQPNRGPAAARNRGIRQASGSLLAFLDSDDHWAAEKLEIQSAALEAAPKYPISHTRETWYRRGVHLNQKKIHQPPHGHIFDKCLRLCCVGMSTVMVRNQLFEEYGLYDESLPCCEDYDFWLKVSVRERFLLIDRPLTVKEGGRSDQVSARYRVGMDRFRIKALGNLLRTAPLSAAQRSAACRMLTEKCRVYGRGCLKHGKKREGEYYLRLAHTLCPAG